VHVVCCRGNALLVGVGGSGKQTLTRFASFMAGMPCICIELTRAYGSNEFREDIRKLYRIAGVEGRPVTFLFTDNHVVNESFVEDINCVLSSGDIAGQYRPLRSARAHVATTNQHAVD
jgi:dynein heavy chain, axonemal